MKSPVKSPFRLFSNSITIGIWTFISRISGLAREIIFAALFGSSAVAEAFQIAFTLPNLFRQIFAEGAFSSAFIPMFAKKEGAESGNICIRNLGSSGGRVNRPVPVGYGGYAVADSGDGGWFWRGWATGAGNGFWTNHLCLYYFYIAGNSAGGDFAILCTVWRGGGRTDMFECDFMCRDGVCPAIWRGGGTRTGLGCSSCRYSSTDAGLGVSCAVWGFVCAGNGRE